MASSTQASDFQYARTFSHTATLPRIVILSPHIQTLQLRDRQVKHFNRTTNILDRFYFYIDGSEMGTGKTYIAAAHAILRKLPVIVVCPLSARQNWLDVFAMYGVSMYDLPEVGGVMTYDTLRSRKGYQPKHGLLVRDDSGDTTQFYATSTFTQIVTNGVLLIFDEFQKLKNTSDQYRAAKALMRQFYVGGSSRAAFLSGTAMDKPDQAVNFLRMAGFIEQRNLYSKIRGQIRLEGVEDLHNWARRIDVNAFEKWAVNHHFRSTRNGAIDYVFELFTEVIKPGIMSIMPSLQLDKSVKNGYFRLSPEEEQEYRAAIVAFAQAVRYDPNSQTAEYRKENMGAITTTQIRIQTAKMKAMARRAREDLAREVYDEQGRRLTPKVILYADYYEVIDYLMNELREFGPVELTGRIKEHHRNDNIARFQQPNTNCRLLIGNPIVGGLSINLHDITGLFPRFMYIMPGYKINELHQATGRTARDGLIGTAYIRFFYGLSGSKETNILSALQRKGETMEKVHVEQGAKFPNQYESEYEEAPII